MTKHKSVNEPVARGTRTIIQATPAYLIALLIDSFWNMDDNQFGIVVLLLTAAVSFIQTAVENYTGKGLLRHVPPTASPVVDNDGTS